MTEGGTTVNGIFRKRYGTHRTVVVSCSQARELRDVSVLVVRFGLDSIHRILLQRADRHEGVLTLGLSLFACFAFNTLGGGQQSNLAMYIPSHYAVSMQSKYVVWIRGGGRVCTNVREFLSRAVGEINARLIVLVLRIELP